MSFDAGFTHAAVIDSDTYDRAKIWIISRGLLFGLHYTWEYGKKSSLYVFKFKDRHSAIMFGLNYAIDPI